jgi:cytochrome P450
MIEIPTFLMAGHETSSTLMCWLLLELASNPSTQASLRAECHAHPLPTLSQGSEPLNVAELNALDKLPLLDAVIRETMRVHSPAPCVHRAAVKNDVIPLARPFVDRDGFLRESIAINKGDAVYISISTVDRLVELWGPDAKEWKPERWLSEQGRNGVPDAVKGVPGVWSNMLSFLGGERACIGFRFSLYE